MSSACVILVLHSTGVDIILTFKAAIELLYVLNVLLQSSVSLDDVFKMLMDFRADESLCRGTKMWKQVSCSRNLSESLLNMCFMYICNIATGVCLDIGQ